MIELSTIIKSKIFSINNINEFNEIALKIFHYQSKNNIVYSKYLELIKCKADKITDVRHIPFMPIRFFKSFDIVSGNKKVEQIFKSSGTTNKGRSKHIVTDIKLYEKSFIEGFKYFYGNIEEYVVLALLPNYIEQGNSSLIYMVDKFIEISKQEESGYFLNNIEETHKILKRLSGTGKKVLLIGVTYALLDLIEKNNISLSNNIIIMETGGMKGRRKELTKQELHKKLKQGFGVKNIHSEYGMTELLSQAYSKDKTLYQTPPWMKVYIRDINDPLSFQNKNKTGGINIIDLANINSCSFIATEDLGRINIEKNTFEILGRFDHSDTRGCNLLVV